MKFADFKLPSNKKFGLVISCFLILLGAYLFYKSFIYTGIVFIFLSLIILGIAFIKPSLLTNLNKGWMLIGYLLGKVINPLVLVIIFFIIITPLGFFLRMIGRDELNIQSPSSNSFWKIKKLKKIESNSFKKQF